MPARSRYRDTDYLVNSDATYNGSVIFTGDSGYMGYESCDDTTMPPPFNVNHSFSVLKRGVLDPVRLTGTNGNKGYGVPVQFNGYSPYRLWYPGYLPSPEITNWAYWETKAIANLSPEKPKVDIPLFIFELKDFPRGLKNLGDVLKRRVSSAPGGYLATHFGWRPLASDVKTLFDLTRQIDGQIRHLRKLERGSRFRRTLFNGHVSTASSEVFDGFTFDGWRYRANEQITRNDKVWATARAQLVTPLPPSTDLRSLSARQVLGLNANPASVWDFIPWTWLIDYFGNVGDFMQANYGLTQISIRDMCIMHTQNYEVIHTNARSEIGVNVSPYRGKVTAKRRAVFGLPIPWLASRPFLNAGAKLAIGSLLTAAALGAASKR